ncbi:MAG: replicative DNA helicase [Ruminococcaceae bacterium]|nr:replicative DNA helicase [Oscillospiraceae bacterium]
MDENNILDRKLPFSLIAEQSLLGSILIDPECLNELADQVAADDFYLSEHKQIFLAMRELYMADHSIDVVTLIDALVRAGVYDKSGGEQYIRTIAEVVPGAQNAKDYAKIVREKSQLRRLIDVCGEITDIAYSEQQDAEHTIEYAEAKVFELAQGRDTKNFRHIRDVLVDVYAHLHLLATDKSAAQGTPTGFSGLDKTLVGMGKSDVIIVGARPGMGKTSFALNIATNVAQSTKKKVCIFSLEMSAEQLVNRIVSSEAMVDSYALRSGELKPEEWEHIAQASARLSGCDILIDDTPGITVTGMKGKLRRVDNLGLVVIDYLGLMSSDKKIENRANEVGDISRNIKIMAKELGVPIICCAQLNRGSADRSDKRPTLTDLRDSGSIEQDADCVIFLYRDEYYKNDATNEAEGNIAEVIVAKNRHGSTGTVKVGWIGRYTKFRSIAESGSVPEAQS